MIWDPFPSSSWRERARERERERERESERVSEQEQSYAESGTQEKQNRRELSSYEEAARRGLIFSWKRLSPPSQTHAQKIQTRKHSDGKVSVSAANTFIHRAVKYPEDLD